MSVYGHFNAQYHGNKIKFPEDSFLIAGISNYQEHLKNINFDNKLILQLEPTNIYDPTAIEIIYNNNRIGYVPKKEPYKTLCLENIDYKLKIINIKKESDNNNFGIRVILDK